MTFTREHQQKAGQARYRQLVTQIIMEHPSDADECAKRLSCIRLNWGFQKKSGLTGQYVVDKAREYGLDVPLAREEEQHGKPDKTTRGMAATLGPETVT